ncbi:MAG: 4-alpha-glucanotransferase, partial [Prevotellaceae bacterium]|nr:4-alpha-glucanotransferase [Prevotellaceae bacterium]
MNVVLHINYRTHWGQKLVMLTDSDMDAQDMVYEDNGQWALNVSTEEKELRYRYGVVYPDGRLEKEVGMGRLLRLHLISTQTLLVYDSWRGAGQDALMSSPFTSVFFQKELRLSGRGKEEYPYKSYILTARASCIPAGCRLCVVGNDASLGEWDAGKALLMEPDAEGTWFTSFVPRNAKQTIYYKYALYDLTQRRILEYENVEQDRQLKPKRLHKSTVWQNDEQPSFSLVKPKGAGVAVPVFSLRSNTGYGVGQFSDLKLVADWAEKTGLSLIQVLPINDTTSTCTWTDSYPYSAISVFALHPLYLDLAPLEPLLDAKD